MSTRAAGELLKFLKMWGHAQSHWRDPTRQFDRSQHRADTVMLRNAAHFNHGFTFHKHPHNG